MKLAVIACSNGLGHTRRIVAILSYMIQNGFDGRIDAWLSLKHLRRFKLWDQFSIIQNYPRLTIRDFEYPMHGYAKTNHLYTKNWLYIDLPNLNKYDIVWSDNILQVLNQRPDAKITGSFLWHDNFKHYTADKNIKRFVNDQEDLLYRSTPKMAGNEYFSTTTVKTKTNFFPVGLYRFSSVIRKKTAKGILMSCGLGGEESEITRQAVKSIIQNNNVAPETLYVEPRCLPSKYPKWIKAADFTPMMYHNCSAACIRPGMGTVSDSLICRARIFAFCNKNSHEMNHNSTVIENLKVGTKCKDPLEAYDCARRYVVDEKKVQLQHYNCEHLRTDGVFATAQFLLEN